MENNKKNILCPACGKKLYFLTDWEFSGFENSVFNYTAEYFECLNCGLVKIGNIEDDTLSSFYEKECYYYDSAHFDINAEENIKKFSHYFNILNKFDLSNKPLADVGCGRGGFLIWLKNNGWKNELTGVDIDLKSIPDKNENSKIKLTFKEGSIFKLPFEDNTQSILSYFHVFEHIINLDIVIAEAKRVLEVEGCVLIEVPDAARYSNYPIGTAFWISIREHVNHYTSEALQDLFLSNGFEIKEINRSMLPTPEFSYPSLIVLAQKTKNKKTLKISKERKVAKFLLQSKDELIKQVKKIEQIHDRYKSITFWGFSVELFSLFPKLKNIQFKICDSSKQKQQATYNGKTIEVPDKIKPDGALLIAPYLYGDTIEKNALELGWNKSRIFRLQ